MMQKSDIRKLVAWRKRQHREEELQEMSLAVTQALRENPFVRGARTILLYYSMRGEVDTHGLVEELRREGKTVLLPRVVDGERMELVPYTGVAGLRPAGSFHILEPQGEPFTDCSLIDVAVIPGIAFTPGGKRMGRGRGYYDRLLVRATAMHKIGLCFPFQLFDDLPTSASDIDMDEVVTASPSPL